MKNRILSILVLACSLLAQTPHYAAAQTLAEQTLKSSQSAGANSQQLFRERFFAENPPSALFPARGYFYRGVCREEVLSIIKYSSKRPKAFLDDYEGLSFRQALNRQGARGLMIGHTAGDTRYFTSVTRNVNVAREFATKTGYVLRISLQNDDAYPTRRFSLYPEECEYIIPGIISIAFIEYYDARAQDWRPTSEFKR